MPDLEALVADLGAGTAELDAVLDRHLATDGTDVLAAATPATGWSVGDTLAHLAGFDDAARRALEDPAGFAAEAEAAMTGGASPIEEITDRARAMAPAAVLRWWRTSRAALIGALGGRDPRARVPWYGPPMSMMSFVTARLMETWAHGQDVRDALGEAPEASDRLRHVAHIGVGARPFSYAVRGREMPEQPVEVVLTAPSGAVWRWGPEGAGDRVEGPALDFCLVVTQRRHLDDTELRITGDAAGEWMAMAQAFAGPPGPGRAPLG